MNQVKVIKHKGYTLTHSWLLDSVGLKRNNFEISRIREDGMKITLPFLGNLRVIETSKSTVFTGDNILPYENWEYLEMMNEQIKKSYTQFNF